jgi:hypothetical protein
MKKIFIFLLFNNVFASKINNIINFINSYNDSSDCNFKFLEITIIKKNFE